MLLKLFEQKNFLSNCSKQLVTPVNLTRKKIHKLFNFQDWERAAKAKKLAFIEVISAIVYSIPIKYPCIQIQVSKSNFMYWIPEYQWINSQLLFSHRLLHVFFGPRGLGASAVLDFFMVQDPC